MSKNRRRRHTPQQKADLLREHLADKKPVSEICTEAGIGPGLFYSWALRGIVWVKSSA